MGWQNWIALLVTVTVSLVAFMPQLTITISKSQLAKRFDLLWDIIENKYFNYIVIVFMLIGTAVRLWKFGVIPAGFNQDGAMGAVEALALAHHGTDRFGMWMPVYFTAWGYAQMNVLLSYLTVPFIWMFGLNRIIARVPVVIISLLALWVIFSMCKLVFNRGIALTVLAFCAINPWQIMQSRWALDCIVFPNFFLFSMYFLCLALKKRKFYLYLSMIFFGLAMYAYGIAWYTVPLFLLIAGIYLLRKNIITVKELILSAISYLIVAWPIFGVAIVNLFRIHTISTPFLTIPYFQDTTRRSDIVFFSSDFFGQLINNIRSTIEIVVFQKPDLPWNTIPEYGTIYLFSLPFLILGLAKLLDSIKEKQIPGKPKKTKFKKVVLEKTDSDNKYLYMPIIIWLITAVISGIVINNVNVNRINIIFYPIIILCGIGIYYLIKRVRLLSVAIILIYAIAFAGFNSSYFGEHSKIIGQAFYDGFGEAMEYVKDMDYDVIYITNWTQTKSSAKVSEPLALFHHQVDALYFQGKADMYDKNAKKLLPYKERYRYVQISSLNIDENENAVYIVHNNETEKFDKDKFEIKNFAYYNAVIPKKLK